jgi:purine nucleosidase
MTGRTARALTAAAVAVAVGTALAGAVGARAASAHRSARPVVVYDSDMDFDDAATLAFLAEEDRRGRIDLAAVTVVDDGAGLPGKTAQHARCILDRLGRPDVPVAEGSPSAPNAFPADLRQTIDQVLDAALPGCQPDRHPTRQPAPALIRQVLGRHHGAQLIVTGPLSNVASARPGPDTVITSMGGAIRVPGNLCCGTPAGFDGSQEFNYWIDPAASRAVLNGGRAPVRLVPLDAANSVPITPAFVDRLAGDQHTPAAALVLGVVGQPGLAPLIAAGLLFWWDPLAAMTAVRPGVVGFETARLDVLTAGPSAGRTVLSATGPTNTFGNTANQAAFESTFLDALNGRP